jgi:hypothetical protein
VRVQPFLEFEVRALPTFATTSTNDCCAGPNGLSLLPSERLLFSILKPVASHLGHPECIGGRGMQPNLFSKTMGQVGCIS